MKWERIRGINEIRPRASVWIEDLEFWISSPQGCAVGIAVWSTQAIPLMFHGWTEPLPKYSWLASKGQRAPRVACRSPYINPMRPSLKWAGDSMLVYYPRRELARGPSHLEIKLWYHVGIWEFNGIAKYVQNEWTSSFTDEGMHKMANNNVEVSVIW
jgi:hypothetical protein